MVLCCVEEQRDATEKSKCVCICNSGSVKATVQTVTNTNPRASAPDAGQARFFRHTAQLVVRSDFGGGSRLSETSLISSSNSVNAGRRKDSTIQQLAANSRRR